MATTPSKADANVKFLYFVLTVNGNPTVDWDPICAALELEKGAATKRWSRLKDAMDKGDKPAASSQELLWLMVKHSPRGKAFDWDAIARECGSTKAAVSKRYSRMKLAFERGDAQAPSTPGGGGTLTSMHGTPAPMRGTPTPMRGTPTPKRKRTPAKANYAESEDEEDESEKPKRARATPKSKSRPKNSFRASDEQAAEKPTVTIKGEPVEEEWDVFTDAREQPVTGAGFEDELDEISPASIFSEKFTRARDMADMRLNRKTRLAADQRREEGDVRGVFSDAV